jgi:hypothetical protein
VYIYRGQFLSGLVGNSQVHKRRSPRAHKKVADLLGSSATSFIDSTGVDAVRFVPGLVEGTNGTQDSAKGRSWFDKLMGLPAVPPSGQTTGLLVATKTGRI